MAMQEMRDEGYGGRSPGRLGGGTSRREARPGGRVRPEFEESEEEAVPRVRRAGFGPGVRLRFRGGVVPASTRGRVAAGMVLLGCVMAMAGAGYEGRRYLLHDERFAIPSSRAIEIEGNRHLSRAQVLSVFGEDIERNVFRASLEERRMELEALPWVEHATVMRLLPNRLRVAIVERTPVAFVRQGKRIGLVDRSGVLLDMAEDGEGSGQYSFPVVTGITQDLPLTVRAARMKLFARFEGEMGQTKEDVASKLSEVDLSNPEDVKALIPDEKKEILVHFGDRDFLERYEKFRDQMPGWRTQYPKLASADMRYERQVVLEMQAGAGVPVAGTEGEAVKAKESKAAAKGPRSVAHGVGKRRDLAGLGQPHFPHEAGVKKAGTKSGTP